MFKKRSAKKGPVVGLELDPSHIAAAEAVADGAPAVRRSAVSMLRPGIVRDGEVVDAEALADSLRELFAEYCLPTRVRVGIAHQRIVVRTMDLPLMADEGDVAAAVAAQAADHIPMPMEEAVLDHQVLGPVVTPQGPCTRVLIVAVRREMIERLVDATSAAGLTVEGIDLSAFAMVRAIGEAGHGARLYVNVSGITSVAVANDEAVLFARSVSGGFEAMAQALAERRGLTLEHARQWLTYVGLTSPVESIEGDPDVVAAARAILIEGSLAIADAVRGSLEYYRMQENAEAIEEGLLTGPAVAIAGFAESIGDQLRLAMRTAVPAGPDGEPVEGDAGRLAVAAGLSLAERRLAVAA